jgi:hypothetical protein
MMRLRRAWPLLFLALVLLLSGCSPSGAPPLPSLTPVKARHFTISLPPGWEIRDQSETGDQVILGDPKDAGTFVSVFTFLLPTASKAQVEQRWQFAGRSPVPFTGEAGREGLRAEGPRQTDPATQILAVGYWQDGSWEVVAEAGAPKEQFAAQQPLLTAILKTLRPDPITDK